MMRQRAPLAGIAGLKRPGSILLLASVLTVPAAAGSAAANWVDLGGGPPTVRVIESDGQRTVLEITLGGFEAAPVEIDGRTFHQIRIPGESIPRERGHPALPDIRRSLIIPDDRRMAATLLSAEYRDLPEMPVAPSKGPIPRSVDPSTVPYTFAAVYGRAAVYPSEPVVCHEPYILRDFRGMVLAANVFRYFPATRTLRVYTRMVVEITPVGPGNVNVRQQHRPGATIDRQFARIYEHHFLNFDRERYEPLLEDGSVLIITHDDFRSEIEPLYEWRLQSGISTRLINVSEIGSTESEIKDYLREEFETTDITYVLLVGDGPQIPTFVYTDGVFDGPSDPSYACLAGGDAYPEIFVGRFSAETAAELRTQVARTIAYERDATADASWLQYGTGIASDQGPGHHGEYDHEHMAYIREDLLGYGYVEIDSLYAPLAEHWMVAEALNEGRGIVNYCGHGSVIGWQTTGFDTSWVNNLVNTGTLPFICSSACRNGRFDDRTCFAEVWLRATHNDQPTGAIAVYMSSFPQDWDSPMTAQDEAVDLMVADAMRTIGGLWFNGSCLMLDEHGAEGVETFLTWHIFGDPALAVRTRTPEPMVAEHGDTLFLGESEYAVVVPGVADALCALYAEGVLYGAVRTDSSGQATILMETPPEEPVDMLLTVTAYNKVTLIEDVLVIPTSGPCLDVVDVEYIDGNMDGILNAGEAVIMRTLLRNNGLDPATGVRAAISTVSEFISIASDTVDYPDIPGGGEAWGNDYYAFSIAVDCPDSHFVAMPVSFVTDQGPLWDSAVEFRVAAPVVSIFAVAVDDSADGNGNGTLDPGESASVSVTLQNTGSYPLDEATGILTCDHPLIYIPSDTGTYPQLPPGGKEDLAPAFTVQVDASFPLNLAECELQISGANGYGLLLEMPLRVGEFFADFEGGSDWIHYEVSDGFGDQWHLSDQRNHTPGGGQSWKCGDDGAGPYALFLDSALETPPIGIGPDAELTFWMWIDAELALTWPDSAYDGGVVELSIDGGPFEQIAPVGGYPYIIKLRGDSYEGPFPHSTPVFSGTHDWEQVTFELGDVWGTAVIRFRFGSDGADGLEDCFGWHIDDVELIGLGLPSEAGPLDGQPVMLALSPSAPNPFRGSTRIAFAVPTQSRAVLQVFDPQGRLVRTLLDGPLPPGHHTVTWHGRSNAGHPAASGVYYFRLATEQGKLERATILLR